MFEATVSEFPFVESIPKREKSKLQACWDEMAEFVEVSRQEQGLVTVTFACKALKVSRTRIDQMCEAGILKRFEMCGHVMISVRSIRDRAEAERQAGGRPKKSS
jgi:hypothetical protein